MVEKWFRRCPALPEQFNFPTFFALFRSSFPVEGTRGMGLPARRIGGLATHAPIKAPPGLGAGLRIVKAFRPIA